MISFFWDANPARAIIHGTVSFPDEQISFSFEGDDETTIKRALGCIMLTAMPPSGLDETLQSLREFLEFYTYTPKKSLPSGQRKVSSGQVVVKGKRPGMVIGE